MRRASAVALAVAALAAAGCGGDSAGDVGEEPVRKQNATPTPTPASEGADLTDTSVKPEIPKPTGDPPTTLEVENIVQGKGRRARAGDTVTVQYVGVSFSTGEQFDASWDSGRPFGFELGAGKVIQGWDEGIVGMRVGGRRKLTIPPDMAYGAAGSPPVIGPDETLVFVVDLLEIR